MSYRTFRSLALLLALAAPVLETTALLAQDPEVPHGNDVHGVVRDESGDPLSAVAVRLPRLGRSELSHADGRFHLERVPAGDHVILFERIGYRTHAMTVSIEPGGTVQLDVVLAASAFEVEGFVVTGTPTARAGDRVVRPIDVLSAQELTRRLESTVASTLESQPGMAAVTMGPATARPVIRGLGGDRVLVLEDGERVGDVSAVSSDHATAVDPSSAQRIEVVRGPSALLYGSQALGGVVNVVREEVPRTVHHGLHATVSLQGQSVNDGLVGSATLLSGWGDHVALRLEGGLREAGDLTTPEGALENTGATTRNLAGGVSWVGEGGHIGGAYRFYGNDYGIPGGFVGAHPTGVDIEMTRHVVKGDAQLREVGPFDLLEGSASHTRYNHKEIEPGGILGTEYGLFTTAGEVKAHHGDLGALTGGTVGVRAQFERFGFGGGLSTTDARRWTLSAYAHEEMDLDDWTAEAGVRWDHVRADALDEDPDASIGNVRDRAFHAFSGSLGVLRRLGGGFTAGFSVARAFRAPDISELYSEGPHLASYSFEVGNPDLGTEVGTGVDLFLRLDRGAIRGELAAFRNSVAGYLYPRETGEISPRTQLPIYQYTGADALLVGFESGLEIALGDRVAVDGTLSWVRGTLVDDDEPLPFMPPLNGRVGLRYDTPVWFAGAEARLAAQQDRLGEFETATDGYAILGLSAGLRTTLGGRLHTLTLRLDNATDETYRNHLSRTKEIMPEAGRGVSLVYRLVF
ncbi:TonB-dependent receptor [Gemmatimonadota bacterium Y43]|uniref:TonB-dependent receptor n=1 Tax=Gaopeijia maritima TaxID=3119007 RepID=UPI003285B3FF